MRIAFEKIQTFYLLLCITFCSLFVYLSTVCYFSDSEIWLLASSKKAFSTGTFHYIYYKWFFHVVVFATSFWAKNNLLVYEVARIVFALIALSSLVLTAATFSKIYQKKHLFLPLVLVCLTSSLFFNQGFRIRADILAFFLHSIFLFLVFHKQSSSRKRTLLFIFLNFVLIITTAKALIFIAIHVVVGLYFYLQTQENKFLGKQILISVLAPLTAGLFALSCFAFIEPDHIFLKTLKTSADFYLKSFDPDLGGARFFKSMDFMYVMRFLRLSHIHTLLFLGWLVLFFINIFSKKKNSLQSFLNIYAACVLIQVLLYNQKLPFFLGPFLTPVIALQFCAVEHFLSSRKLLKWLTPLMITFACWLCWKQFAINFHFNNNRAQKEFISQLQSYKQANPGSTIYDIIGLLPQNNTYYAFIGPGEVTRRDQILNYIRNNSPDIYLYTFKNIFFGNELLLFLKKNYVEYSPGVWVKALHFEPAQNPAIAYKVVKFNNQNYWLIASDKPQWTYSHTAKKDIVKECLYLDAQLKLTHNATKWVAVPLEHLHFSFATAPLPQLSENPFTLFRFDTLF